MSTKWEVFCTELETILGKYDGLLSDLQKCKATRLQDLSVVGETLLQGDKLTKQDKADLERLREMLTMAKSLDCGVSAVQSKIDKLSGNKTERARNALKNHRKANGALSSRMDNDTVSKWGFTKPTPVVFRFCYTTSVDWQFFTVNVIARTITRVLSGGDIPGNHSITSTSMGKKVSRVLLESGIEGILAQFASEKPFADIHASGVDGIAFLDTTAEKWLNAANVDPATGMGTLPVETVYKKD